MKIKIIKEKIVKAKTVFKADLLNLAGKKIEAIPVGDFFVLQEPFRGIPRIKKDFCCNFK